MTRHTLVEVFSQEFACYRTHADRTLASAWTAMKTKGFSLQNLWAAYKHLAVSILPVATVDSLLFVKGSWDSVQGDLQKVVESELGEAMFGFALCINTSSMASKTITDSIEATLGGRDITVALVEKARAEISTELDSLPNRSSLNAPRNIDMKYRGVKLTLKAKSLFDELNLRLDCKIRNVAISHTPAGSHQPLLTPLFCELSILEQASASFRVDAELLAQVNAARRCANEALDREYHDDSAQVKQTLEDNMSVFDMVDASFRIEVEWFSAVTSTEARD